ncbi:hypothetical protein CASFOL_011027 [Castilleja foliolosa]|uniref:Uncharacterized protein n=1 Tax=Castilleja foliolosa TaxID=1961234 RepID=A0ABD3DW67_9LAMI
MVVMVSPVSSEDRRRGHINGGWGSADGHRDVGGVTSVTGAASNRSNTSDPQPRRPIHPIQHLRECTGMMNRGTFGVPSAKKSEIGKLVQLLESQNPNPEPTLCLEKLDGTWKLIYSTITILGSKRTKLGLRDFITLDDIFQFINVAEGKAVNVIRFSAKGLNLLSGELTIEASFKVASKSRVDISYDKSVITPHQHGRMVLDVRSGDGERLGFEVPTQVQAQAIPVVLSGRHVLVNAATGTGKTVAYLAPIIHLLQEYDQRVQRQDGTFEATEARFLGLGLAAGWSADYLRGCNGERKSRSTMLMGLLFYEVVKDLLNVALAIFKMTMLGGGLVDESEGGGDQTKGRGGGMRSSRPCFWVVDNRLGIIKAFVGSKVLD